MHLMISLLSTGCTVIGDASSDGIGVSRHVTGPTIVNNDLFQALRGGGNNFGIFTKFTLKTFAQNDIMFGSYVLISGTRQEKFKNALVHFVENEERPEACLAAAFRHELVRGKVDPEYSISIFCVFDVKKPKKKCNVPFKALVRLQESGDAYAADPAGWQLGKTSLALSALELKTSSLNSKMLASLPGTPQPKDDGRRKRSEDSDAKGPTGYFQEMSWSDMYEVLDNSSDTDSDDDDDDGGRDSKGNMGDSSGDDDSEEDSEDDSTVKKSKARKTNKNSKQMKKKFEDDDDIEAKANKMSKNGRQRSWAAIRTL
ncbi:hypothetical protein D9758_010849 [Tetrapyrgos nigripes]|uniref:Uncharacterized protein n=1 Tax=Tetrapyrgos nigripes TaxID=182062 RepID=A0A8H5LPR5_9AGAR|nr:hypothetical protein D9758_010849 [Tetrapyrgos nigripes]